MTDHRLWPKNEDASARKGGGLPPAPTWDMLDTYVAPMIQEISQAMLEGPMNRADRVFWSSIMGETHDKVMRGQTETVAANLHDVIAERGKQYGEDVLMALGEQAIILFIFAKFMRLFWHWTNGHPFGGRRDSWMDIAGYAVLALAINEYMEDNHGEKG